MADDECCIKCAPTVVRLKAKCRATTDALDMSIKQGERVEERYRRLCDWIREHGGDPVLISRGMEPPTGVEIGPRKPVERICTDQWEGNPLSEEWDRLAHES